MTKSGHYRVDSCWIVIAKMSLSRSDATVECEKLGERDTDAWRGICGVSCVRLRRFSLFYMALSQPMHARRCSLLLPRRWSLIYIEDTTERRVPHGSPSAHRVQAVTRYPIRDSTMNPPIIKRAAEARDSNLISTPSFANIPYYPVFSHQSTV